MSTLSSAHPATSTPDELREITTFRSMPLRRLLSRHGQLWSEHVSTELTSIQFGVLLCLGQTPGGLIQTELGVALHLDKATVTELVRRMSRRGLVRVERDPHDGRRRIVTLTEQGERMLLRLHGPAVEVDQMLLEPLASQERDQLDRMLAQVLDGEER